MTVAELIEKLELTCLTEGLPLTGEVTGGYTGDLLSWVMGRLLPGFAWITIMSNQNVAAVAVLCDASCVILAEDVMPDEALLEKALEKNIILLKSALDSYSLSGKLYALLGGR